MSIGDCNTQKGVLGVSDDPPLMFCFYINLTLNRSFFKHENVIF